MSGSRAVPSWRGYVGLSLVWLTILGGALLLSRRPSGQAIEIIPPPTASPTAVVSPMPSATAGPLRVDIAGAVRTPGVYTLPPGALVADAIAAAGGPATDADLDRLNKAVALADGMQVYVPRQAELTRLPTVAPAVPTQPPLAAAVAPTAARLSGTIVAPLAKKININTASTEELDTLPGVGPATAQAIIAGRPYSQIEDLLRVKGIGPATLEKFKDAITVR